MKSKTLFGSTWNFWLISIDGANLNAIKLSFITSAKLELNRQTGLYSSFVSDILNNNLNIRLRKQKQFKIDFTNDNIQLIKSKLYGKKLLLTINHKQYSMCYYNPSAERDKLFLEFESKLMKKIDESQ